MWRITKRGEQKGRATTGATLIGSSGSLAGIAIGMVTAMLAGIALSALPAGLAHAQIYKVTDGEKGVVFTDSPENISDSSGQRVEQIELPETNTAAPVQARPPSSTRRADRAEAEETERASVSITSPANESTIAMGPGNFAVSASAKPPLSRGEALVLLIDGQPVGPAQQGQSWLIEGALRGPHDLVVQRVTDRGGNIAISEPVRVYVLRPSIR